MGIRTSDREGHTLISFDALSSHDLELLVQDLLQADLKVTLESFTTGRDGGIDLRYLGSNGASSPSLIVQCKHYEKSGFSKLKSKIVSESTSAKKLSPKKYMVATTVPMTPHRKTELRLATDGLISGDDHILGKEDLQNLLRQYPEVEKAHFKLWLNSTAVLDRIINNDILNRTEGYIEALQNKARLFVNNASVEKTLEILDSHHVCIISGPPGIGKTTLADIILMMNVAEGYQPVLVSEDIKEADRLYKKGVNQIFLYDDFLGRTSSLEKLGKNEDGRLLNLMQRVQNSPTKRFILTTREYIFEQARQKYDLLDSPEVEISKLILDVSSYGHHHRAHILYNHLYFSGLSTDHLEAVVKSRKYREIASSANYNPRVVQTAIDMAIKQGTNQEDLPSFLVDAVNNPTELWRNVMTSQLSIEQRTVLALLALEDGKSDLVALEAFCFRLSSASVDWQQAVSSIIRGLEGTTVTVTGSGTSTRIQLYNPGVEDAVIRHILAQPQVLRNLVLARPTYSQLVLLWNHANEESRDAIFSKYGFRIGETKLAPHRDSSELANPNLQRALDFHLSQFLKAIMGGGLVDQKTKTPFESLVANVIRMSQYVTDGSVMNSDYSRLADAVVDRWARGLGDRSAALDLLRMLVAGSSKMPEAPAQSIVKAGIEFIMSPGSRTPDDFMAQHALVTQLEEEPDSFEPTLRARFTLEKLVTEIEEFIPEEVQRILSEAELHDARSTVESWDEVLHELGLNDEGFLDHLWAEVERAEEDSAGPDEDGGDYRSHSGDEGHADIDVLFSSLADQ